MDEDYDEAEVEEAGRLLAERMDQLRQEIHQKIESAQREATPDIIANAADANLVLKSTVVIAEWEDLETGAVWISTLDTSGMDGTRRLAPWHKLGLIEFVSYGIKSDHS